MKIIGKISMNTWIALIIGVVLILSSFGIVSSGISIGSIHIGLIPFVIGLYMTLKAIGKI